MAVASLAADPESGWAVRRRTRAPLDLATPHMASTVGKPPGPAEARRRSEEEEMGGALTSPTQ